MNRLLIILLVWGIPLISEGQFFGHKSVSIHQGIILFNNDILNNPNNANTKKSFVSEVDHNLNLSRFTTFSPGIGFGNYQNPDNRFETYQSTNFLRLKIGLTLHLPQKINRYKLKPNLISPFFKVGYNFDVLNNTFKAIGNNKVNTNLRLSIGNVFRLSHELGLFWESSLNQRVNIDYRTFFQHNFGLCINLDERLKVY
ncbi:MAG: hypothetical protein Q8K70_04010 [Bacteroidota bacterium]|nr:hypothetical protein [Bacteroidota bacterium]